MTRLRLPILAIAASPFFACGHDAREPFFGVFEGSSSYKVNWSDNTIEENTFDDRIYIAPANDNGRLFVGELCDLSATLRGNNEFEIELRQCPAFSSGSCNTAELVQSGIGTVKEDSLTLEYASTVTQECPGATFTGTVTTRFSGTRR